MESNEQKSYDLLHDNPVAKDASGGRPWIAKHYKSGMNYGSPMKDKHSAMKMGHSPMEKHSKAQEKGLNKGLVSIRIRTFSQEISSDTAVCFQWHERFANAFDMNWTLHKRND